MTRHGSARTPRSGRPTAYAKRSPVTLLALLSPVLALLLVVVMQRLELRVLTESAGGPEPEPGSSELRDDTLGEEIELLAGVIATVGGRGRHLTDPEVDQALG